MLDFLTFLLSVIKKLIGGGLFFYVSFQEFLYVKMVEESQCYICYEGESDEKAFAKDPCKCKGSLYIHVSCLEALNTKTCKICKGSYKTYSSDGVPVYYKKESYYIQEVKVDKEGKYHGLVHTYFKNNALRSVVQYIHGLQEGVYIEYHSNEEDEDLMVYKKIHYHEGKKHGDEITYYHDGNIYEQKTYKDGVLHGIYRKYNVSKLEKEGHYVDGLLHGKAKVFDFMERLYYFITYENGTVLKKEYPGWIFPPTEK